MKRLFRDGRLLPPGEAAVPVSDRGFLYGDTVFETIAVHAGRPFGLDAHMARLEEGLQLLGYPAAGVLKEAQGAVAGVLDGEDGHAVIRLTVSRGSGPRGLGTREATSPVITAMLFGAPDLRPMASSGLSAVLTARRRPHPGCLPPQVKCGNYLANILAAQEAEAAGTDEALMLDWAGEGAACFTTGNLFVEADGALVTPPVSAGALGGTMRARLIALAAAAGIACREDVMSANALAAAPGLFLSNSVRGVAWVSSLGGVPKGKGPLTQKLAGALKGEIEAACGGSFLS